MAEQILIVEDETDLARAVSFNLEQEGFRPVVAADGQAALAAIFGASPPDLIVLDLMLPDMSGTEVCRQVRQNFDTRHIPVLMLTAKTDPVDRVVGFEVGADDYVTKPFSGRELVLRIRAILRRTEASSGPEPESLRFGVLRMDFEGHRVWVDDAEVVLTALEFRLLKTLVQRRGRVQTREILLNHVWEMSGDLTTRTVDTHVRRLRKKLAAASVYIETLRGVGYRFVSEPSKKSDV